MNPSTETVVAEPGWLEPALWLGLPALGAALGWLVQARAAWLGSLHWLPRHRALARLAEWPAAPRLTIALLLGAAAGALLARAVVNDLVTVTISDAEVRLVRGFQSPRVLTRTQVGAVRHEGNELVLTSPDGAELWRERPSLDVAALRAAFVAHGYPWRDRPGG